MLRQLLAIACCLLVGLWPLRPGFSIEITNAGNQRFELSAMVVTGSTVYNHQELYPLYAADLGRVVDERRLHTIADAITSKYRADGYLLARAEVPAQTVEYGVVRMRVIEGAITHLELNTPGPHPSRLIQKHLDQIRDLRPLERRTLERYLALISDLRGAAGSFRIRSFDPDRRDYVLAVDLATQPKTTVYASLDNRGSERVGPIRSYVLLSLDSILNRYEGMDFAVSTTDNPDELRYLGADLEWPLGREGGRLELSGFVRYSTPGDDLRDAKLDVDTESATLAIRRNLLRSFKHDLSLRGGVRHYETNVDQQGDPIRREESRRVTLDLTWKLDLPRAQTWARATYSHGIESASQGPANIDLDFSRVRIDLAHSMDLTPRTELVLRLRAQHTDDRLPVSERIAYGGARFGRGFNPGEFSGDRGAAAAIEARARLFALPGRRGHLWLYGFYDVARLRFVDEDSSLSRSSSGAGIRVNTNRVYTFLELAKPLTGASRDNGDDWRVSGGVAVSF